MAPTCGDQKGVGNMDTHQRREVGRQIASARELRAWSQEVLAERAGIAPNTVSSLEAGNKARPGSLAKVMAALDIEPLAEMAAREGIPPDVHLVQEVIGMWMLALPEADRPRAVADLMMAMVRSRSSDR